MTLPIIGLILLNVVAVCLLVYGVLMYTAGRIAKELKTNDDVEDKLIRFGRMFTIGIYLYVFSLGGILIIVN